MIRRVRAFTLVEFLVIVAIIGVLAALLIPAINAAREASRKARENEAKAQAPQQPGNFQFRPGGNPTPEARGPGDLLPDAQAGDAPVSYKDYVALKARLVKLEEEFREFKEQLRQEHSQK
jgi:hypothetical protein